MAISELADHIAIESPAKLWAVLDSLRSLIERGAIHQIDKMSGPFAVPVNIDDLRRGESWPGDHFEMTFKEISTGFLFRLSCEIYHGSGGTFKRIG